MVTNIPVLSFGDLIAADSDTGKKTYNARQMTTMVLVAECLAIVVDDGIGLKADGGNRGENYLRREKITLGINENEIDFAEGCRKIRR